MEDGYIHYSHRGICKLRHQKLDYKHHDTENNCTYHIEKDMYIGRPLCRGVGSGRGYESRRTGTYVLSEGDIYCCCLGHHAAHGKGLKYGD